MRMLRLASCLSFVSVVTAQQMTVTAATPLVAAAQTGSASATQSVPAGPLPPIGQCQAGVFTAGAYVLWHVENATNELWFEALQVATGSSASASASSGVHDFLLQLTAPLATPVAITGTLSLDLAVGQPVPLVYVDVGDDGWNEVVPVTAPGAEANLAVVTLGSVPLPVRVRLQNQIAGPAHSIVRLRLTVRPSNLLRIDRVVIGCSPLETLDPQPSFAGTGVDFHVSGSTANASVLVLGLQLQPIVLPSSAIFPCIVAPSADVLIPFFGITLQTFTLPLPAAVRPVNVFAQLVQLFGSDLRVTSGYCVQAN